MKAYYVDDADRLGVVKLVIIAIIKGNRALLTGINPHSKAEAVKLLYCLPCRPKELLRTFMIYLRLREVNYCRLDTKAKRNDPFLCGRLGRLHLLYWATHDLRGARSPNCALGRNMKTQCAAFPSKTCRFRYNWMVYRVATQRQAPLRS